MIPLAILIVLLGGVVIAERVFTHGRISALQGRVQALEAENRQLHEKIDAVLLEESDWRRIERAAREHPGGGRE
ncbi:MAG: hypothetical protein H0W11_07770 [Gemmatimonadetes bacterium]|jgi:hypothetical protein|nr:hypothetical protein [Gemmatimonadota bacterium]